jgi:outer membrane protein
MKNVSIALNVVLVIAVAVLYYLHFSSNKKTSSGTSSEVAVGEGNVLYINTDSVVMAYNFTKDKSAFMEENNKQREQMLRNKQAAYENAVRKYQQEAPIMTERERAKKEEQIMGMQNELLGLQQQYQQDAMMEEQALLVSIIDTLENFMADYVKGKEVDYVLGYQKNGTIFYRNPARDITADVIEKLNSRYKSENPAPVADPKKK